VLRALGLTRTNPRRVNPVSHRGSGGGDSPPVFDELGEGSEHARDARPVHPPPPVFSHALYVLSTPNLRRGHRGSGGGDFPPVFDELGEGSEHARDARPADVFSLGCLVHATLCGAHPFLGGEPKEERVQYIIIMNTQNETTTINQSLNQLIHHNTGEN